MSPGTGQEGPIGPIGHTGAQGNAGWTYRVSDGVYVPPGRYSQATVNCPDDAQKVLGGGGSSTNDRTYHFQSSPSGAGWTVVARNTSSSGATI